MAIAILLLPALLAHHRHALLPQEEALDSVDLRGVFSTRICDNLFFSKFFFLNCFTWQAFVQILLLKVKSGVLSNFFGLAHHLGPLAKSDTIYYRNFSGSSVCN